jgi:hexosaminidase
MRQFHLAARLAAIAASATLLAGCCHATRTIPTADYAVVPLPREIVYNTAERGFELKGDAINDIASVATVELVKNGYPPEGYSITVTDKKILIEAGDSAGAFYALQTLRKSLPVALPAGAKKILLPAVRITDSPALAWRGMHLDVSRHFFDVAAVERYIDLLALHNLNRFHFHLTDDQGWRMEIKKYPRLTEIGSQGRDAAGNSSNGFFTQDELRHIVEYAAERHITVIPEVDMPGHMLAALAAFPELGCTGGPYGITGRPGVMADILCAGNDATMPFLKDIFAEVVEIFPSEYIHIGGDEAPRDRWRECPKCQARIGELGLEKDGHSSAEAKLQSWMVEGIGEFLASHGRKIIGWDEILEGGAPADAAVMAWRSWMGVKPVIEAVRSGHDVVMTPTSSLYFDYPQTRKREGEPPFNGGGLSTLEMVYNTNVYPAGLTPEERAHIIGVQANLWTEYIATVEHLDYMALPRMGALAEVAWSYTEPEERDFAAFLPRIARMCELYKKLGYNPSGHLQESR